MVIAPAPLAGWSGGVQHPPAGEREGARSPARKNTQNRRTYDPWGKVISGSLPQTRRNFTGQYLDDTGLLFYNARYYDPGIGRFVSADSIVPSAGSLTVTPNDAVATNAWGEKGVAGNPQELNCYSYVNNNPVKNIDPSGHGCGESGKSKACSDPAGGIPTSSGGYGGSGGGTNVGTKPVHPNSDKSTAPHHIYEIFKTNTATGQTSTYKYGISSKPLNVDGTSPRAHTDQVYEWNKSGALRGDTSEYSARILATNVPGRTLAKKIEQALVDMFARNNPRGYFGPPGNRLPRPTPR